MAYKRAKTLEREVREKLGITAYAMKGFILECQCNLCTENLNPGFPSVSARTIIEFNRLVEEHIEESLEYSSEEEAQEEREWSA